MTTYARLKDETWGIRSTKPISKGDRVTVQKKDGTFKTETVGQIVWKGNGIHLATIDKSTVTPTTPTLLHTPDVETLTQMVTSLSEQVLNLTRQIEALESQISLLKDQVNFEPEDYEPADVQ
jgi:hypothetical protein